MNQQEQNIDLQQHWKDLQKEMQDNLYGARKQPHKGSSGDAAECSWEVFFKKYLPNRYSVLHDATIIDSRGLRSDQIDLVIYDEFYTPRIWEHDGKTWIPAESVYCVVECKNKIQGNVDYAGKKIASVRRLHRTAGEFHDNPSGKQGAISLKPIFGILVADRYGWKNDNSDSLCKALSELDNDEAINFICSADGISVFAKRSDEQIPPQIIIENSDHALIHFLMELDTTLRITGTVAPIDYEQYLRPQVEEWEAADGR
ncbi:MAG: hypothetical protein FWF45_00015 [Coriobacteriia bacterium]|nr:hypothetical protein [Coriobacteriia bacterium]